MNHKKLYRLYREEKLMVVGAVAGSRQSEYGHRSGCRTAISQRWSLASSPTHSRKRDVDGRVLLVPMIVAAALTFCKLPGRQRSQALSGDVSNCNRATSH
jgi:hypothetical protein